MEKTTPLSQSNVSAWAGFTFLVFLVSILGTLLTLYLIDFGKEEIAEKSHRLLYTTEKFIEIEFDSSIESAQLLAKEERILRILSEPTTETLDAVNNTIDTFQASISGAEVCYVLNTAGAVVCTSNRNTPQSFLGKNYAFRPYFIRAMEGEPTLYYAIGVTSGEPGFYFSAPVYDNAGTIHGVVVIKRNFKNISDALQEHHYCFFVDKSGIIFLSSMPGLEYKSLYPLSKSQQQRIIDSREFGPGPFTSLFNREVKDGDRVSFVGEHYYCFSNRHESNLWSLILLAPVREVTFYKAIGILVTVATILLICIFFTVLYFRKRGTQILLESEKRFKSVAEISQDWIWEIDANGVYTYSSESVKNVLGYEPKEVIGHHYSDFFYGDKSDPYIKEAADDIAHGRAFYRKTNKRKHKNGHTVFIESSGVPLVDRHGRLMSYRGVNRNITEQIEYASKLKIERDKAQQYMDIAGSVIMALDTDGFITLINKKGSELLGLRKEHVIGKNWFDCFVPENIRETLRVQFKKYLAGTIKDFVYHENYIMTQHGQLRCLGWHNKLLYDDDGSCIGTLSSGNDVTEHIKSENELKKKIRELERFHEIVVNRELKMRELKEKISELEGKENE